MKFLKFNFVKLYAFEKKLLHLGFFNYLKKSISHFMFGFGIFLKINRKLTSGDSPSNNLSGIFVNLKSKKYTQVFKKIERSEPH